MSGNLAQKPGFVVPNGVDPKRYYLCLIGPLALGLSIGMQLTVTALLLLGPVSDMGSNDQLTGLGKSVTRPEHDLGIYAAGCLFTLIAALAVVWWWRCKLARIEAPRAAGFMASSALVEGVLAVGAAVVYALLVASDWFSRDFLAAGSGARQIPGSLKALNLLVPCAVALVCAAIDLGFGSGHPAKSATQLERQRLRINNLLRYALPAFVILVLGVPPETWSNLAGQIFLLDSCHHLNFFIMGPAISFSHGKAFGTEIYSQYGIGWPLLASMLSHFWALTYGNLVGMEVVHSCIYYLALFFLLRIFFKQQLWAAFGVVLAIYWQAFSGINPAEMILVFPSSSSMRHPMDVWFFLALVMHQRSGKLLWAALAGLVAALGVFFETETGAYLLVTFLIYWILQAGVAAGERPRAGVKEWLSHALTFYSVAGLTLLALLLGASRGTLFTAAFWRGWVEALVAYAGGGVGALPIAALPDIPLIFFMCMVASYLAAIVYASVRALHGSASRNVVLLATLAAYGLALLLMFVNRSHPYNLCHAAIPFAVFLAVLIAQGHAALERSLPGSLLPSAFFIGLVALLLTKADFRRYPSCLGSFFGQTPSSDLALRSHPTDLSGLPPNYEGFASEFQQISSAIQTLTPDRKGVAILDMNDTPLYSAANICPWSRYTSLFNMALTQQSLDGIRNDLIGQSPRYVVIRGQTSSRPTFWEFVWTPLYAAVTNRYSLSQTVGSYEIWQARQQ